MRYLFKTRLKYIAEFILVGAIVVGLLILMDTQKGEAQGGKEQAEGLIPAKLTVQWISEKRKTTEGEEGTHSYRSYRAEEEEKETLDATFNLEVPDINYWRKPDHIYAFGYVMGKVTGPEHLEVPRTKRVKLPKTKLISYDGAVSYKFRSHQWLGLIMGPDCERTENREGSGQLSMEPYGLLRLVFMGENKAEVQIRSAQLLTVTGEERSTCDVPPSMRKIHRQRDPMGAVFPMVVPIGQVLPGWSATVERTPSGLKGTATYQGKEYGAEVRSTMTWSLSLNPYDVEAIHGPYPPIVRGDTLNLDGSRSKGKNLKYEWTFNPKGCPDGLKGNPNASKKGSKTTVRLLCDTDITLKVTDGKDTNEKTVSVVIQARDWKTEVLPQIDAYLTAIKLCLPQPYFGRNVCALDGAAAFEGKQESGHIFHKEPNRITWEDTGYKLGRVNDSNGPFDGWWYVVKNHLKIQRAALINTYLNKNSELYEENKKKGYKKDFDTLINQVTAHEQMHGTLMEEAIPKNDPAKKIEMMIHPKDKDALKLKIDLKIQDAEKALWKATKEDNVKERLKKMGFNHPGKVLLKLCNIDPPKYKVLPIPSFATLGD